MNKRRWRQEEEKETERGNEVTRWKEPEENKNNHRKDCVFVLGGSVMDLVSKKKENGLLTISEGKKEYQL